MRGLLITRSPLQSNRSLSLSRFQWERFGAPAHDPLDTQRTREPDQFPLPARSGEWIKVRGISVGILMLSQNESRDTWGARPPRAQWLAPANHFCKRWTGFIV